MRDILNNNIIGTGKIFILVIILVTSCNYPRSSLNTSKATSELIPSSSASQQVKIAQNTSTQSLRHIDFHNFEFPITDKLLGSFSPNKSIRLVNGTLDEETNPATGRVTKPGLFFISSTYENVNGNVNDEEAIIVLGILSGGSSMGQCVYVYERSKSSYKPSLLWAFDTGDRSHGGLRRVYGENGNFIVELYNNDFSRAYDGSIDSGGACCAKTYTKATYEWTGLRYQLIAAEKLNNTNNSASPITQPSN